MIEVYVANLFVIILALGVFWHLRNYKKGRVV